MIALERFRKSGNRSWRRHAQMSPVRSTTKQSLEPFRDSTKPGTALALGMIQQDLVARTSETEHATRNLLDEIRIRGIGAQQRDIALELGAHGLEAQNLELKSALALEQLVPRLEAVSAFDSMKGKVGRKT
jgi:hypothetical protein